jgi:hypothetical protein
LTVATVRRILLLMKTSTPAAARFVRSFRTLGRAESIGWCQALLTSAGPELHAEALRFARTSPHRDVAARLMNAALVGAPASRVSDASEAFTYYAAMYHREDASQAVETRAAA